MEKILGQIVEKLDKLGSRFDNLEAKVDKLELRFDNLESGQKEHTQLLQALESRLDVVNVNVLRLQEDMNYLRGEVVKNKYILFLRRGNKV